MERNCSLLSILFVASFLGDGGSFSQSIDAVAAAAAITVAVACLYPNKNNFPFVGIVLPYNSAEPGHAIICVKSNTPRK